VPGLTGFRGRPDTEQGAAGPAPQVERGVRPRVIEQQPVEGLGRQDGRVAEGGTPVDLDGDLPGDLVG
jgi:hypothetical protein